MDDAGHNKYRLVIQRLIKVPDEENTYYEGVYGLEEIAYDSLPSLENDVRELNFLNHYEEERYRPADSENWIKYLKVEEERKRHEGNVLELYKIARKYELFCYKWDKMKVYNPDGTLLHEFRTYKAPKTKKWKIKKLNIFR